MKAVECTAGMSTTHKGNSKGQNDIQIVLQDASNPSYKTISRVSRLGKLD